MKKLLLSLAFLMVLGITKSNAQDPTLTSIVGASIAPIAELSATNTKDAAAFTFSTAAELTAGKEIANVFTLTAKANKAYYVTVKAAAADFSGGVAGELLPVSVLAVSIDGGTTYVTLSSTDKPLIGASGSKIPKGSNNYNVNYRMIPGVSAAPATDYTTTLTYTITAP